MDQHTARVGEYWLVLAALPGTDSQNIGVLLLDIGADRLHCRFRRDFEVFADHETDWFRELPAYITQRAQELGGQKCIAWLESTLSHAVRISTPKRIPIADRAAATVDELYLTHIRPKVLPYVTHLPQFSLEAAAGKFGKQMSVEPEGWVEVPSEVPLLEDMFVTHVRGHSMEPLIADNSLCAFRSPISGSWNGRVLLFEKYDEAGGNRYTVKVCRLSKAVDSDVAWLPQHIALESINPKYESWEYETGDPSFAEKIRAVGEFLFMVRSPSRAVKSF